MSANSVLPPFEGSARACSSEYLAGITLNELSECQSRLPMANCQRRSSRLKDLAVLVEVRHVGEMRRGQALVVVAPQIEADGDLQRPEALGERQLLLVGEVLAVEHQHRIPVHSGIDGGDVGGRQRLGQIKAR